MFGAHGDDDLTIARSAFNASPDRGLKEGRQFGDQGRQFGDQGEPVGANVRENPRAHAGRSHAVGHNLAIPSIVMAASAEDSCGKGH